MHGRQTTGSMVHGYHALTEKEKQTLRLLLDGHDAKSMAQHLGLSVHTVNERLRDARRKLAVSSSKAAARLLRQAECPAAGATPETLGDSALGDARAAPIDQRMAEPSTTPRRSRRTRWAIGGFAMIALVAALLAQPLPLTRPAETAVQAPVAEDSVTKAARDWLDMVDASKWQESWASTAPSFRALNTVAVWQAASENVRAPLGPMVSRTLVSAEEVPGPPRGYKVVRFRTDYTNRRGVLETLSLGQEDGTWKVVGIYVE